MNLSPYKFVLLEKIQRVRGAFVNSTIFRNFSCTIYMVDSQKRIFLNSIDSILKILKNLRDLRWKNFIDLFLDRANSFIWITIFASIN